MALWWIPPLSIMTFYVFETINIFAAILCISNVSPQPFSLMSSLYISSPAALKISRGHQILSPPQRPAGVAWRGPWNTPLERFEEDRWPAPGSAECVSRGGVVGTEISDYQGAIWKRLSPRRSAIPRQIGRGGVRISVRGGQGSFGAVGGEWCSSQMEHQGQLIHDQRHGEGAADGASGGPGSWGGVNAAYQDHREGFGGWGEANLTHGDTHSTLDWTTDRLD